MRSAVFVFLIAFLIAFIVPVSALDGWNYYRQITITNNAAQTLTNYQVNFTLDTANLIAQGKMRSDCGDLRVTLSDGQTLLPYWVEPATCNTNTTKIWTNVSSIPANGLVTILVWYGNQQATPAVNGSAVFPLYSDWESGTLEGWNVLNGGGTGSASVVSLDGRYQLKLYAPNTSNRVQANKAFNSSTAGYMIETILKTGSSVGDGILLGFSDGSMISASQDYPNNGYVYSVARVNNAQDRIDIVSGGQATTLTSHSNALSANTYYRVGFAWYSSTFRAFFNNVQVLSATNTIFSSFTYVFVSADVYDKYFDWLFVRKYVSPEPSISVGNELIAKPDLTVISADYSPKPASVQQQISISAQIANTGNWASPIANVTLYIDGNAIQTAQVSGLNPNETTTVTFAWIPNAIGTYAVTIVVDPDNVISEINENNNSYNLTIEVSRIADLTVNVTLPESGTIGKEVAFSVVVMNTGSAAAYNFSIAVYIDTNEIDEKRIAFLDPGGQILFNYSFIPHEARTYTVTAIVDPENNVIESAENNNAANATIEIIASSSITKTPGNIIKIPTPPKPEGRTLKEVYESTTLKTFGLPLEVISLIALLGIAVVGYGFGAFRGTVNLFFLSVLYYMATNALGWSTYIATGLLVVSAILLVIVVAFMRED